MNAWRCRLCQKRPVHDSPFVRLSGVAPKSPFYPPFSKGELFRDRFVPSLEKRGRGDLWEAVEWKLCSDLLGQDEAFRNIFSTACLC